MLNCTDQETQVSIGPGSWERASLHPEVYLCSWQAGLALATDSSRHGMLTCLCHKGSHDKEELAFTSANPVLDQTPRRPQQTFSSRMAEQK